MNNTKTAVNYLTLEIYVDSSRTLHFRMISKIKEINWKEAEMKLKTKSLNRDASCKLLDELLCGRPAIK